MFLSFFIGITSRMYFRAAPSQLLHIKHFIPDRSINNCKTWCNSSQVEKCEKTIKASFKESPKCINSCACQARVVSVLIVIRIQICMQTLYVKWLTGVDRFVCSATCIWKNRDRFIVMCNSIKCSRSYAVWGLNTCHTRTINWNSSCPSSPDRRLLLHPSLYQPTDLSLEELKQDQCKERHWRYASLVVTPLILIPIFEKCLARFVDLHWQQEDMCCNEIGLCAWIHWPF